MDGRTLWTTLGIAATMLLGTACGAGESTPARRPIRSPISPGDPVALADLTGRVVFSRDDDVFTANPDGSAEHRLTRRPGPEFDPSWSPGGTRVAYRDSTSGINDDDEIYVMNADGSPRRDLTNDPANDWGPAWSPDGRWIAFNSDRDLLPQIYVVHPDGTGLRRLTEIEGEYPAWSSDGSRIAFMSMRPGAYGSDPNYDVYVMNADGTGQRRLTDWPGEDGWPAWSPDGSRIAYTTSQDDRHQIDDGPFFDVYMMNADGTAKRRLVTIFGMFPVWSADGRSIMFAGSRLPLSAERLWVVPADGGPPTELPIEGTLPDWTAG
jgi:Tol biopolymer transport system component